MKLKKKEEKLEKRTTTFSGRGDRKDFPSIFVYSDQHRQQEEVWLPFPSKKMLWSGSFRILLSFLSFENEFSFDLQTASHFQIVMCFKKRAKVWSNSCVRINPKWKSGGRKRRFSVWIHLFFCVSLNWLKRMDSREGTSSPRSPSSVLPMIAKKWTLFAFIWFSLLLEFIGSNPSSRRTTSHFAPSSCRKYYQIQKERGAKKRKKGNNPDFFPDTKIESSSISFLLSLILVSSPTFFCHPKHYRHLIPESFHSGKKNTHLHIVRKRGSGLIGGERGIKRGKKGGWVV